MAFQAPGKPFCGILSRKFRLKNVLFALILICILWIIFVQYFGLKVQFGRSHVETEIDNSRPLLDVVEVKANGSQQKYVFILPKRFDIDIYNEDLDHLMEILQSFRQYDGAACHSFKRDQREEKRKPCWFKTRNWTMLISGPNGEQYHHLKEQNRSLWICNIVEFPYIIRQTVFNSIGLNQSYGEATLLDFFLRSNGTLKIAVSQGCVYFSEALSRIAERESSRMINRQILLDYGLLGYTHNLLRIVRQDSITWTKCSYKASFCPDVPEQHSRADNILLPYCCKTTVNEILIATVNALNQIGMNYRVCFSTLLGAIRSKTAIPWDGDVDMCLKSDDFNVQTFEKLKDALKPSNYSYAHLFGLNRVVPLNAFVKHISNYSLVSESDLFSEQALRFMREMLPIYIPTWKTFPYADFYMYDKIFERNIINVIIDGIKYPTGDKPHELLREWYGNNYMSKDKKDWVNSASVPGRTFFQKMLKLVHIK